MITGKNLAFLGLGVMGASMAANLVKKGFPVTGWNRTPTRKTVAIAETAGVTIVKTIAEAVSQADIIFTCLGDIPDVEEVILGAVAKYARPQALVVDFSTIGSEAAKNLAIALKNHHLRWLDAPISGGDVGAREGTLTIMVGGQEDDFQECLPYLQAMGKNITLCGPVGSGQAVKMCNQVLASIQMVALCEAIALAQQQGIDPNLMIEVCSTGAAGSWALINLGPKITQSDFNPGFMIKHILKDLRIVQEIDSKNLPGISLAEQLFKIAAEIDNSLENGTQAMFKAYQKKSEG
jgi:3-hydroxyisobutyrate dehydrogenase